MLCANKYFARLALQPLEPFCKNPACRRAHLMRQPKQFLIGSFNRVAQQLDTKNVWERNNLNLTTPTGVFSQTTTTHLLFNNLPARA